MLSFRRLAQIGLEFLKWLDDKNESTEQNLINAMANSIMGVKDSLLSAFLQDTNITLDEIQEWYIREDTEAEKAREISTIEFLREDR